MLKRHLFLGWREYIIGLILILTYENCKHNLLMLKKFVGCLLKLGAVDSLTWGGQLRNSEENQNQLATSICAYIVPSRTVSS